MKRRDFLRTAGSVGLGVGLFGTPSVRAAIEPYDGPYICVFNAKGGWDTTMLMDPRGTELNALYQPEDIVHQGALSFAPNQADITAGMSNEAFLQKYWQELRVINGIDISVNNHDPCSRYMGSGKLDSHRYPAFGALAAAALAPEVPLAFMALDAFSTTGSLVAKNTISDFPSLLNLARADYVSYDSSWRYLHKEALDRIDAALATVPGASLPKTKTLRGFMRAAQTASYDLNLVEPWVPESVPADPLLRKADVAATCFA